MSNIQANSDMGPSEVWNHCQLEEAAQRLAKTAMEQLHFSVRAYHRTLKLGPDNCRPCSVRDRHRGPSG